MLFMLNKIINSHPLLKMIAPSDTLILFEDGVYNLLSDTLTGIDCEILAIETDLVARQITNSSVTRINYDDFVKQCSAHERIAQLS